MYIWGYKWCYRIHIDGTMVNIPIISQLFFLWQVELKFYSTKIPNIILSTLVFMCIDLYIFHLTYLLLCILWPTFLNFLFLLCPLAITVSFSISVFPLLLKKTLYIKVRSGNTFLSVTGLVYLVFKVHPCCDKW